MNVPVAPTAAVMPFAEFCSAVLGDVVDVAPAALVPQCSLVEDLGLDSLEILEVLFAIDDLAAQERDPVCDAPLLVTLGDAYDYYRGSLAAARRRDAG